MNQWDKVAKAYDEMMGETGDIPHQELIDPAIKTFLGDFSGKVILDAGCGNGYWVRFLASKANKVIGIDASKELIKIAKSKDNPSNVTFKSVDLNKKLPFKNEIFDIIISSMVLHFIQNIERTAKEFRRVLKENGKVIFSIPHPLFESTRHPDLKLVKREKRFTSMDALGGRGILEWYYRPISFYRRVFNTAGLKLIGTKEPQITNKIATAYLRYKDYVGMPRAAIFCWQK